MGPGDIVMFMVVAFASVRLAFVELVLLPLSKRDDPRSVPSLLVSSLLGMTSRAEIWGQKSLEHS